MNVKIGFNQMVFVGLSKEQEKAVENHAGKSIIISEVGMGLAVKGEKADMFDLLCALSYDYDLEVN